MSSHDRINIGGRNHADRFYRYKMPALESDIKRRNKTVITNMVQIAKALDRPPEEVIKFLGYALSSSGSYSAKTNEYQVSGKHSRSVLQSKIHEYCELFVICKRCEKPEPRYVAKRDTILLDCRGCGHCGPVNMEHKLCKSILAQQNLARQKKKKAKSESSTSKKWSQMVDNTKSESAGGPATASSSKKAKQKKQTKQTKQIGECLHGEAFENPFFKTRGNPLYNGHFDRVPAFSSEVESIVREQATNKMKQFLEQTPNASTDEVVVAATRVQESARILLSHERVCILLEAVFAIDGMASVRKYTDALAELSEDKETGEYLISIAQNVCVNCVKKFPFLLMHLYEHDIVSEGVILTWWANCKEAESNDQMLVSADEHVRLRKAAEPLISWLEMASDSDDCE